MLKQGIQFIFATPRYILMSWFHFTLLTTISLSSQSVLADTKKNEKLITEVRQRMQELDQQYKNPEIVIAATGSLVAPDEYALREIKQVIYNTTEHKRVRIDYYIPPFLYQLPFFSNREGEFLGTEINIYTDAGDGRKYSIWLDKNRSIQTVLEWGPIIKTQSGHIEYFNEVHTYYDGEGKLLKTWVSTTTADHQKRTAAFVFKTMDPFGKVISTEAGDADYDELACPSKKRHC